ncbi:hypothetical protein HG530_001793 [Fusarium avenaceum]|nr:hypothetical protein HG530_001793 [Fusarium avenaceum]
MAVAYGSCAELIIVLGKRLVFLCLAEQTASVASTKKTVMGRGCLAVVSVDIGIKIGLDIINCVLGETICETSIGNRGRIVGDHCVNPFALIMPYALQIDATRLET